MNHRDDARHGTADDPRDAVTGEVDPAWLARLRAEHATGISAPAEQDTTAGPNGARPTGPIAEIAEVPFDAERTVGGDADLLAKVREAVRQAREGLAAPPPAPPDLPPPIQPGSSPPGVAPPLPATADSVRSILAASTHQPATTAPTPPSTVMDPPPPVNDLRSDDRWRPPPRLKPAVTPQPTVLLIDQPTHGTVRKWVLIGIAGALLVAAALILVVVRSGGSTPSVDTDNGSSTAVVATIAPGAPADVATTLPVTAVATTGVATTAATTAPATIAATTVASTTVTTVPATIAPTIAPAAPPETVTPPPGTTAP